MVEYVAIEKQVQETLDYIQNDLTNIRQNAPLANYAVCALIGCACEVIARLRDEQADG
jgi:hypothetical protein